MATARTHRATRAPAGPPPGVSSGMLTVLLLQVLGPESCMLTGLCAAPEAAPPVPSGVMFTAIGLVAAGLVGLRIERRRRRQPGE